MKIENVRGIVWDLDGTLLDSFTIFEQVITEVVKESGHTMPTQEDILSNYHGSLEDTVQKILKISSAEELDVIINSFIKKDKLHYANGLETYLFKDSTILAQEAAKKGIHQLLVTNRDHRDGGPGSPRSIIAATVLADCIQEVFPGDEVDYRKPDKRSMGDWIHRHGLMPGEVVVIGDQFVDAQLAFNIGARAILVKRSADIPHLETISAENQDDLVIVDDLKEIELV